MCLFVSMCTQRSTNGFQVCVVCAHSILSNFFFLCCVVLVYMDIYIYIHNCKCTRANKREGEGESEEEIEYIDC